MRFQLFQIFAERISAQKKFANFVILGAFTCYATRVTMIDDLPPVSFDSRKPQTCGACRCENTFTISFSLSLSRYLISIFLIIPLPPWAFALHLRDIVGITPRVLIESKSFDISYLISQIVITVLGRREIFTQIFKVATEMIPNKLIRFRSSLLLFLRIRLHNTYFISKHERSKK